MSGIDPMGRVAVVTGGARGIGWATAAALRNAGAHVAIGDLDPARTALAAEELGLHGAFLDDVESRLGPVAIWINNAGIMPIGPVLEQLDAVIRRAVDVNVLGVMNGSRAAARRMTRRGEGRIVNVASIAGRIPAPGMAVYNGTKFAVVGFGEALDAELRHRGVRVSTVLPSFTNTALVSGTAPGRMTRPIPPEEVARAVVTVVRRGRRQAVVPRRLSTGSALWQLFPRPVATTLRRTLGLDTVFLHIGSGRADYDARIARDAYPSEPID